MLLEFAYSRTGLRHTLQRASNGFEVTAQLQNLDPYGDRRLFPPADLLLLDLKMPGMNGFDVLEWLHKSPWWSKLPVVVLSGSDIKSDRDRSLALGARAFYTKTVALKQTQEMLTTVCHDWLDCPEPA